MSGTSKQQRDVPLAIVGMSCIFPEAEDLAAYWRNIRTGVDAITDLPETHWSPADYFDADPKAPDMTYARRGGFLPPVDFNPLAFGIAPNALEATDTAQLLGLYTAQRALEDAGYGADRDFDRDRVSVLLGVTGTLELSISLGARLGHPFWRRALKESGIEGAQADTIVQRIADHYVDWQEASFPGLLGNVVAGRIANRLDLGGTNCVVDAACASSLSALHLASLELAAGRCDMAITGGIDTLNDIFMYMCFSKTPALSPTGDARPFAENGDGTILGEGIGILVLKRLEDAVADGDRIYAELRGLGTASDGKGNAIYAPSAGGQAKALRRAYARADIAPDTIELVEAHGTGTVVGDAVESQALTAVYREQQEEGTWCALGSVKSQIGHTKAASGAASLIKAALALHHRVLPPTIKVEQPLSHLAPGASPFYVNTTARPWLPQTAHPRRAAISSFGFGGANYHCVLQEHVPATTPADAMPDWDGDVQLVALSGATRPDLQEALTALGETADWSAVRTLAAASRRAFETGAPERVVLVLERNGAAPADLAQRAADSLSGRDEPHWSTPDGIYYGRGSSPGGLAFLFPGQGAQYVGMLRDLACCFPEMQHALEAADAGARTNRLSDHIFPQPVFDDEARAAQQTTLRDTRNAQPAIGALSLGAAAVLARFAVTPAATAGHSFGELTALCEAGRLAPADFHALARLRGQLMSGAPGARGAMLAVAERHEALERILREEALDLIIANRNAPRQNVLSGSVQEIERAAGILRARQIDARHLPVSAAFHSPLVADAEQPLAAALADVAIPEQGDGIPVYANSTAEPYPSEAAQVRALLAGQLARPVRFEDQVRSMYAAGLQTFVEVGPNTRLAGLVDAILADEPHQVVSLDASRGKRPGARDLARVLAQLGARGHALDLSPWDASYVPPTDTGTAALTFEVGGANIRTRKREPMQGDTTNGGAADAAGGTAPPPTPAAPAVPTAPATHAQAAQVQEALRVTQMNMAALQNLQQQTALLHQQFLQGQNTSQQQFHTLLQQQQRLLDLSMGMPAAAAAPLPTPVAYAPPVAPVMPAPVPMPLPVVPAPVAPVPVAPAVPAAPVAPVAAPVPAAPIPTPAPTPAVAAATAPAAPASGDLARILLEIVADKTGYPADILELGMELDADLGIDSIKRVEILSALQDAVPDAPTVKPDQLGTMRTLQAVLDFIQAETPDPDPQPTPPPGGASEGASNGATNGAAGRTQAAAALPPAQAPASQPLQRSVLRAREATPGGSATKESAAPTATDAPLWISDDDPALAREIVLLLESEGHRTRILSAATSEARSGEPVGGLLLLPPPEGATEESLLGGLRLLQAAGPGLRMAGNDGGAFFLTASRLDGSFGTAGGALRDPLSGGLAGLSKTASHEWPEVRCRALDLANDLDDRAAALGIVSEMFRTGPTEVGLHAGGRRVLALIGESLPAAPAGETAPLPLQPGELVVVSGGARGVTAEAALALAQACRPTLVLLGRSPEPGPEPAWLVPLTSEGGVKHALLRGGHVASPREAGAAWQRIRGEREIRGTLERLRATGATVHYRAVDVCDGAAVRDALTAACEQHGPVRMLVHGAGVLADQHILEKTEANFRRVYETKVVGLRNLLAAIDRADLRALVLFSSTTARLGRSGQVDYAVANEVLNKLAQQDAHAHPDCRVISLNWGPWEGGMVDAALRTVFADEGIALIPLAAGATHMLRELCSPERGVERVVLGPAPAAAAAPAAAPAPAASKAPAPSALPLVFEHTLDNREALFLRSHVVDGRAVVPMAMLPEYLAHAALHGNPGLKFCGFDDLRVLKGLVLDAAGRLHLHVHAGPATRTDAGYRVATELRACRPGGRVHLHARAEILLADRLPVEKPTLTAPASTGTAYTQAEVYPALIFHGPDMQGITAIERATPEGMSAQASTAPAPTAWMDRPLRRRWLGDPLALDVAVQLLTIWTTLHRGAPSLPCRAGRYRQFRAFPQDGVRVLLALRESDDRRARADMEIIDRDGRLVARIEDCENTIDAALAETFRSNHLPLEAQS